MKSYFQNNAVYIVYEVESVLQYFVSALKVFLWKVAILY